MNLKDLEKRVEELSGQASFLLREDVRCLLRKYYKNEKNKKAKVALGWILENAEIAEQEKTAICQDTGLPVVFVEAGANIEVSSSLVEAVKRGVESGYRKNFLRPSAVDPLKREKPSYKGLIYHIDFEKKIQGLRITLFPKGFGSENKSKVKMFNPTVGLNEIEDFIVDSVREAGPEACPPFIVGVGIGGTSDTALLLAKKALLGKVDRMNPDKLLSGLETRLIKKINRLRIGAMGLGGSTTCLAVKARKSFTHIAGLPVGVNISCHALRSATINI